MVSTPLKNICQNGNLPQIGVKIKNIWNHHLDKVPGSWWSLSNITQKGKTHPFPLYPWWHFGCLQTLFCQLFKALLTGPVFINSAQVWVISFKGRLIFHDLRIFQDSKKVPFLKTGPFQVCFFGKWFSNLWQNPWGFHRTAGVYFSFLHWARATFNPDMTFHKNLIGSWRDPDFMTYSYTYLDLHCNPDWKVPVSNWVHSKNST